MKSIRHVEASTQGRSGFTFIVCLGIAVYFFSDIFDLIYCIPDGRLERVAAIDVRNLLSAIVSTVFLLGVAGYVVMVASSTLHHMSFPYPAMELPVRLRVRAIEKTLTIWLLVSVVFLSLAFQLIVLWYTWYKWHQLLIELSSEL
jgi:hypothetical protein